MGMFDELRCDYPLPVNGANYLTYQTKDTPLQCLELYWIRKDGSLWVQDYDIENHSKPHKNNPLSSLCGVATRVNKRFIRSDFTGEIVFYTNSDDDWLEFCGTFVDGNLTKLKQRSNK